ncbi:MAG: hypothetical protein ACYTG0_35465 [Planctomycetota bacterium]
MAGAAEGVHASFLRAGAVGVGPVRTGSLNPQGFSLGLISYEPLFCSLPVVDGSSLQGVTKEASTRIRPLCEITVRPHANGIQVRWP